MINLLPRQLQTLWTDKQFTAPTAIQEQIFQPLLRGESFIAISPTGTGKTLAYLLPILCKTKPNQVLQAIIMAPSQELVKQIGQVAQEWAEPLGIKIQLVLGGANFKRQQELLKDKPEIIVATPGRFNELATKTRKLKLHQVETVVYDEADYLFDEQNRQAVDTLQKRLMRDVQVVWTSATFKEALQQIADRGSKVYQVDTSATSNVFHHIIMTPNRQKISQLKRLAQVDNMQAIVFFEQVNELEEASAKLLYQNVKVATLHGKLSKQEREMAIRLFTQKQVTYLLTTDMAARGLDIPEIPYVIHFNRVSEIETYIHRSGRTGRMGAQGIVLSLVNEQESRDLSQLLQKNNIHSSERLVHSSKLITPEERPMNDKPTYKPQKTKEINQSVQLTKKKKKVRDRDNKNKGKRKNK